MIEVANTVVNPWTMVILVTLQHQFSRGKGTDNIPIRRIHLVHIVKCCTKATADILLTCCTAYSGENVEACISDTCDSGGGRR
jgi:hypothetical protein